MPGRPAVVYLITQCGIKLYSPLDLEKLEVN